VACGEEVAEVRYPELMWGARVRWQQGHDPRVAGTDGTADAGCGDAGQEAHSMVGGGPCPGTERHWGVTAVGYGRRGRG